VSAVAAEERPLVAVVCAIPLLGEAVESVLEFAEVRSFTARSDTAGLLQWLRPDAVVVDSDDDADAASEAASEHDVPALHISMRDHTLRLFRRGAWTQVASNEGPTPESIRNVLAGTLFAREDH
jgi:hypothetical protein